MTRNRNALELIYRDDSLLAVNKPAGLLAVPGRGEDKQDCVSVRLQQAFPDALVVHRLDMATSGLLLFARGAEMQRRLSRMFRGREIRKGYVALVSGRVEAAAGEIALPLLCDWPNRPRQKVDHAAGKPSLTRYRVLGYAEAVQGEPDTCVTRVALEPVTGRTHQLRVHMAASGHPILGDALYREDAGSQTGRLMLHACSLEIAHPLSGAPLSLVSEVPF